MMDFKQLEAFVNVVKYKNFSRAADASFLTQPTISAHINSLEKELGVTLINRMGKESYPTKEGQLFYRYAMDMIHTRDKASTAVSKEHTDISGILEVQSSSIPGQYLVPILMAKFRGLHPCVRFYLEQSDSKQVARNICDYKGEIGFTGYMRGNELAYEFLCQDTCVIITPRTDKYLAMKQRNEPITIERFAGESLIWREEGSATRKTFEEKCREKGVQVQALATMNNIEAIKLAVSYGMGISVLSEMAVQDHRKDRGYLCFEIAEDCFDRKFYMIYKKNVTLSPAAAAFKNFTLQYFQEQ